MLKFKIYIIFIVSSLGWQLSQAQSEISIYSQDSTQFLLSVNTELVSDSLSMNYDLAFNSGQRANLVFQDSVGNPFLEENLELPTNMKRVYQVRSTSVGWKLIIVSEFELTQNQSLEPSLSEAELNSTTELVSDSVNAPILITSLFKTAASPNLNEIAAIDNLRFESEKIKAIKKLLTEKQLTSSELSSLLEKISLEDKRADLIKQFSEVFTGNLSPQEVNELFKLERYKSKALESLGL